GRARDLLPPHRAPDADNPAPSATAEPRLPCVADPTPARREALTIAQLEARLPEFESAIRGQGLREKTVDTYVSYIRFFLRWLAADGTPERWVAQRDRQRTRRVLDDLAQRADETEIRAVLDAYHRATKSQAALG